MLPRVLEPEAMDDESEAVAYDAMDHGPVNRAFVADLLARSPGEGEILDLGTGTAQIPIELCRRHPPARLLAVDVAAEMLAVAQRNVAAAGLAERIRLARADCKRLPCREGRFAAVLCNGTLHHFAKPGVVLGEAWRVLAPGGVLFFRDLRRPADERTLRRLVELHAAGASRQQRALFEASLRAALCVEEMQRLAAELGLAAPTVRPTSDRHWTLAARKT